MDDLSNMMSIGNFGLGGIFTKLDKDKKEKKKKAKPPLQVENESV